jgi:hypothetical protein
MPIRNQEATVMHALSRIFVGAGAIALMAGSTLAQDEWAPRARKAQASQNAASAPSAESGSTNMVITEDDGTTTQIILRGDEVTAFVNGKRVPADRIEEGDGKIRVLDENGEVISEVNVDHARGGVWKVDGSGNISGGRLTIAESEPRAFIGVTLGEVGEAMAAQLGLNAGEVVLISGLTPGQPAESAGLKMYDIVTKIDGNPPADGATLRKKLSERKPGDEIVLHVLRGGNGQDIKIKLGEAPRVAGYAFGEPGAGQVWRERAAMEAEREAMMHSRQKMTEELHRHMATGRQAWEEAVARLAEEWESLDLGLSEEDRQKLEEALDRVREELANLDVEIDLPRFRFYNDGAVIMPAEPMAPTPAAPPGRYEFVPEGAATGGVQDRLKMIEERMDRIEQLLERLAEKEPGGSS